MGKTYYISESQFRALVESKQKERKTLLSITEEIDLKRKTLTESTLLNEGIIDTIKKYWRTGMLTAGILASLLASQKVDAQQLQQAGIPTELVQQAQEKVKYNPSEMSTKQIEDRLVQIMKRNNLQGSLKQFQNLPPQQKANVLNGIKSKIKSLDDINHISFGNWEQWERADNPNTVQFDKKTTEKIRVETVDTVSTIPVQSYFAFNSFKLQNPQAAQDYLKSLVAGYTEIDSIQIISSSSTLRNKHDAENMTWKELSQARAEAISQLLVGQNVDLGGEGVNIVGKITPEMIRINSDGTNGDGTSGPKSPYEVNQEYVQSYQSRGIDPKFWKSAATDEALPETQIDQYNQYQYVIVKIFGRIVTTQTDQVPSYRYVMLTVKKSGGKVETGHDKKVADVSQCPVKIKAN